MSESAGPGRFVTFDLMCTVQATAYGHHCGTRKHCDMRTYPKVYGVRNSTLVASAESAEFHQ